MLASLTLLSHGRDSFLLYKVALNVLDATILCGLSNQMCKAHLSMEWHQAVSFAKCCAKACLGTQQEKCLKKPTYRNAPKPRYEREREIKGLYLRSAWLNVGQLFEVCRLELPLKHTHICTVDLLACCLTNSCHSILQYPPQQHLHTHTT